MSGRTAATIGILVFSLCAPLAFAQTTRPTGVARVAIGSKVFTESVVLGELATQWMRHDGVAADHFQQLGGTRVLWKALLAGDIDAYPEYSGTILQEILARQDLRDDEQIRAAVRLLGIGMTRSLGFNDTYAIGMPEDTAAKLAITSISNLSKQLSLRFGFSNEFLERKDGWPALKASYGLPQLNVTGLDHDLAYRALASHQIDATDLYSTDAEIAAQHLRVLMDDRRVFPEYNAVFLYRLDLEQRAPKAASVLRRLEGRIDQKQMIALNARVKLQHVPESETASEFLGRALGVQTDGRQSSLPRRLARLTLEHLTLVSISLAAAILVAIPLGVVVAKMPRLGQGVLASVAALYTIPSLALLVFMIPLLGIGAWPAIVALFLYSLLPMVRNTNAGLRAIPASVRESAEVLGLSFWARLWRIELPMASPAILAGIQTSAVINVGTATLGALIGAGGYGQPILTGIRLDQTRLILMGAIPAALLALFAQAFFDLVGRKLIPRGLRLTKAA